MGKASLIVLSILANVQLQAQEFIPLWPAGKKPNSKGNITDSVYNERIWRVATPGIYAFTVPKSENRGTTVLICPGGGYERLSHVYNGFQVAKWFDTLGINAFVLIYRLPHQADLQDGALAPLQDAQRALRLIRSNAGKWNLDQNKMGVFGMSAGGHLSTTLATRLQDVSAIKDALDTVSFRPNFMILVSPVITVGSYAHAGSKKNLLGKNPSQSQIQLYSSEAQVSPMTPPSFIVHALNDSSVAVQNSLLFYNALLENKVNAVLHTFPQGGHGIKMVSNPGSTNLFDQLLIAWLKEMKFLIPKNETL